LIVESVRLQIANTENIQKVLRKVESHVKNLNKGSVDELHLKRAAVHAHEARIANLVDYVARGKSSDAVEKGLEAEERHLVAARQDMAVMQHVLDAVFTAPPIEWVQDRLAAMLHLLSTRTKDSALALRQLLGKVRMEPIHPDIGKPYYAAHTSMGVIDLLRVNPSSSGPKGNGGTEKTPGPRSSHTPALVSANAVSDRGSDALRKWR
jgi:hypothetical protein